MTDKEKTFCEEYLVDLNGAQSAIRAGYSEKTANAIACNLFTKVYIQEEIQRLMKERAERTEVTADKVVMELAKIAFSDMKKFATWGKNGVTLNDSGGLSEEDAACVSEVSETETQHGGSIRFKLHDKKGALDSLCRHLGMFTDNINVSGSIEMQEPITKKIEQEYEKACKQAVRLAIPTGTVNGDHN